MKCSYNKKKEREKKIRIRMIYLEIPIRTYFPEIVVGTKLIYIDIL